MVDYDRGYYVTEETLFQGRVPNIGEAVNKTTDLYAYEKSKSYKFSRQFHTQFARAVQFVKVSNAEFPSCGLCRLIGLINSSPAKWNEKSHGSSADPVEYSWPYILALSQECDSCHLLEDYVKSCLKGYGDLEFAAGMESARIGIKLETFAMGYVAKTNQKERVVAVKITIRNFHHQRLDGFVASKAHQRIPMLGAALKCTDKHIDPSRLRNWLSMCDRHPSCQQYVKDRLSDVEAIRVIDVQHMQLVEINDLEHCAALSYTWGPIQLMPVKLLRENLSEMKLQWALVKLWPNMPRTIRDAIHICQALGIKYLWCDALCIIQDDEVDVQFQMGRMYTIYKYCHVTLVSAAGKDAQAGLPGTLDHARENSQWRWYKGSEPHVLQIPATMMDVHDSPWNLRGWTLQEAYLSRRMLIFTSSQVFFQCQTTVWYETIALEEVFENSVEFGYGHFEILRGKDGNGYMPGGSHAPVLSSSISRLNVPDADKTIAWERYLILIYHYSSRRLSKSSDLLHAVSGILKEITNTYGWEFHFGLPLSMFPVALCFKSIIRKNATISDFPTWSWCSALITGPSFVNSPKAYPFAYKSVAKWFRTIPDNPRAIEPILDVLTPLDTTEKDVNELYTSIRSSLDRVHTNLNAKELASLIATETYCVFVSSLEGSSAEEAAAKCKSYHDPINPHDTFAYYHVISRRELESIYTLLVCTDSRGISRRVGLKRWDTQQWQSMKPQPGLLLLV